ncbi:MAG TPA: FadR/GntR family transcriptional regulator [Paracoccus sp. (in: a-proteobacteria)]|uniref:FadR/GntR family transcriptional regulator n=1 Tax=Paracoccus sp. TaxID=267 RepID=UPI002CE10837|nr:FadR/GntR family transcriptional regulator [Paracoccus sp. (in: a-proteobacteria)]HWL57048.1 FadR/GntR family transcriptional regulator [Paracoccus sp. (in: a-proteobacteria)]
MGVLRRRMFGNQPRSSHARVVEGLGRAIISGEFSEGETLPGDQQLLERFGVSRSVLREAMKTLAAKGLILAKSRVGTRVNPHEGWNFVDSDVISWKMQAGMDREFVAHLRDMRLAFEPAAARLAAIHATSDEIVELFSIAARIDNPHHTRESVAEEDLNFHLAIAAMSRNPFMRSVTTLIEAALAVSFQISSPALSPEGISRCASQHLRIASAIASRDPEAADAAMREVVLEGAERASEALAVESVPGPV